MKPKVSIESLSKFIRFIPIGIRTDDTTVYYQYGTSIYDAAVTPLYRTIMEGPITPPFRVDSSIGDTRYVVEVRQGTRSRSLFYILNGVCYDIYFPLQKAAMPTFHPERGTNCGPADCTVCARTHSNGVFMAYCDDCAEYAGDVGSEAREKVGFYPGEMDCLLYLTDISK